MKTHGPNDHPTPEHSHGHGHEHSQSKINHYSKDQDHIILSSDIPGREKFIAEINEKTKETPDILEISKGRPYYGYKSPEVDIKPHSYRVKPHIDIKQIEAPDLSKFRPVSSNIDYSKYLEPSSYDEMNEGEYFSNGFSISGGSPYKFSGGGYRGGSSNVVSSKIKKLPSKPLITLGLKHYASPHKDYTSYFRNRQIDYDEEHDASRRRMVQRMQSRNPTLLIVPKYAYDSSNYFF